MYVHAYALETYFMHTHEMNKKKICISCATLRVITFSSHRYGQHSLMYQTITRLKKRICNSYSGSLWFRACQCLCMRKTQNWTVSSEYSFINIFIYLYEYPCYLCASLCACHAERAYILAMRARVGFKCLFPLFKKFLKNVYVCPSLYPPHIS